MNMYNLLPISIALIFFFAPSFPAIEKLIPTQQKAQEPPFHTSAHTNNKALPQHITENITIQPSDGIVVINTTVTVHENAILTLQPGVTIAVAEYAGIQVFGKLYANGTKEHPVAFISNEQNETNRNWNGILFEHTGSGTIEYALFHHASPSISCLSPEKVIVKNTTHLFGNLDVYGPCRSESN